MTTKSSIITALLFFYTSTASLSAAHIRFWNHTPYVYKACLYFLIKTSETSLETLDCTIIPPYEYTDRVYKIDLADFLHLTIENGKGWKRNFDRPFNKIDGNSCTIRIDESKIEIKALT